MIGWGTMVVHNKIPLIMGTAPPPSKASRHQGVHALSAASRGLWVGLREEEKGGSLALLGEGNHYVTTTRVRTLRTYLVVDRWSVAVFTHAATTQSKHYQVALT